MRHFCLICVSLIILVFILVHHISPAYAETYTYDKVGRLTKVTYDDGSSITYNYDNAGNLLQQEIFTIDDVPPVGNISYSAPESSHVDQGTLTITGSFSESLMAAPTILVTGGGPLDAAATPMVKGANASIWTHNIVVPPGNSASDNTAYSVTVSSISDLAGNLGSPLPGIFTTDTKNTDGTGLRDYEDTDDDDDGMLDTYENTYGLDPLVDDSAGDLDGDGYTNIEEYYAGTLPNNEGPNQPALTSPANGAADIQLTLDLMTQAYSDSESDTHMGTRWQVCRDNSFTEAQLVFDFISSDHLVALTVPETNLDVNTNYYWRVMFFDNNNGHSLWSVPFSFTTIASNPNDMDNGDNTGVSNGVPDSQDVASNTVDIDNDGTPDTFDNSYKAVNTLVGNTQIGVQDQSVTLTSIDCLESIDPATITDTTNRPAALPFGIINLRLSVAAPGDTVIVDIFFADAVPAGSKWYKYDELNSWQDYSAHAAFVTQRHVQLTLVDGGAGDSDGLANGVIIDPSGIGVFSSSAPGAPAVTTTSASGGGGGGACFIATAAFGPSLEKHGVILSEFRDRFLIGNNIGNKFVEDYYRYSPDIADYLRKHEDLRLAVRLTLIPIAGVAFIALSMNPLVLMLCILGTGLIGLAVVRRKSGR